MSETTKSEQLAYLEKDTDSKERKVSVQDKEYLNLKNTAKEKAVKNICDLKLPEAEQNKILSKLEIYEKSPQCKLIDNLSQLNSEQTKQFFDYCGKDCNKALVYLSLADNPKDIINEKFREDVAEESRKRNAEISKQLETAAKEGNTADVVNKLLNSGKAYTKDQLLVLNKMREEQSIPVICTRVQPKKHDNLNLPGKRQVFIVPLEDIMGQHNDDIRKVLGFSELEIKKHSIDEYNIYTMEIDPEKLGRVGWDDVQKRVEDYLDKLKNSKNQDDIDKFYKIAENSGFDSGENWKQSFEEKVFKPIREHVPTEEGFYTLNQGCQYFSTEILEKNFGINENFTGYQISATVGEGVGGTTEYVIIVPYMVSKGQLQSVIIPCKNCASSNKDNYGVKVLGETNLSKIRTKEVKNKINPDLEQNKKTGQKTAAEQKTVPGQNKEAAKNKEAEQKEVLKQKKEVEKNKEIKQTVEKNKEIKQKTAVVEKNQTEDKTRKTVTTKKNIDREVSIGY